MAERTPSADEWERAESNAKSKRSYRTHACPFCGRVIHESAYSGTGGNFDRHVAACRQQREDKR